MDALNLLKMTLARATCDDFDCENCKELFNTTECPCEDFDYDTRMSFVKALVNRLNLGPADLGDLEDMKVEDLLKVIDEAMVNRKEQLGNVDEPEMLEDHPVDYRAIAEEIEMPF